MKKTLIKLLAQYPDKIEEISDESRSGDGYWLYLKAGWQRGDQPPSLDKAVGCHNEHQIHEWNMKTLEVAMRCEIFLCQCWDCKERQSR